MRRRDLSIRSRHIVRPSSEEVSNLGVKFPEPARVKEQIDATDLIVRNQKRFLAIKPVRSLTLRKRRSAETEYSITKSRANFAASQVPRLGSLVGKTAPSKTLKILPMLRRQKMPITAGSGSPAAVVISSQQRLGIFDRFFAWINSKLARFIK